MRASPATSLPSNEQHMGAGWLGGRRLTIQAAMFLATPPGVCVIWDKKCSSLQVLAVS